MILTIRIINSRKPRIFRTLLYYFRKYFNWIHVMFATNTADNTWCRQGFRLPECCRRSRSRPVTGSCRWPPGPGSECWGCETGAFSSSCRFGFSSSCQRIHSASRRTHTHTDASMRLPFGSCQPLWRPWKWMGGWIDGRIREWVGATEREDGERVHRRRVCFFPSHPLALSLSLLFAHPQFFSFRISAWTFPLQLLIRCVWCQTSITRPVEFGIGLFDYYFHKSGK